jgi:hypothetical protein
VKLLNSRNKLTSINLNSTLTSEEFKQKLQDIIDINSHKKKKRTLVIRN